MTVSSGTYVRSIIHDIAAALGSVAHVVLLSRTRQGEFTLEPPVGVPPPAAEPAPASAPDFVAVPVADAVGAAEVVDAGPEPHSTKRLTPDDEENGHEGEDRAVKRPRVELEVSRLSVGPPHNS